MHWAMHPSFCRRATPSKALPSCLSSGLGPRVSQPSYTPRHPVYDRQCSTHRLPPRFAPTRQGWKFPILQPPAPTSGHSNTKPRSARRRRSTDGFAPLNTLAVNNGSPSVCSSQSGRNGPGQDLRVLWWSELQPVPVPSGRCARVPNTHMLGPTNRGYERTRYCRTAWHRDTCHCWPQISVAHVQVEAGWAEEWQVWPSPRSGLHSHFSTPHLPLLA